MLLLDIAFRFIKSRKLQSILLIVGFSIGVGTNLFIGNLISSIEDDLIDRTINAQPHITITNTNSSDYISDYSSILSEVESMNEITQTSKILEGRSFIMNYKNDTPEDIIVKGFSSFREADNIFNIFNSDFQGSRPAEANEVILGKGMAEKLGIGIGDILNVSITPAAPLGRILIVKGLYDLGSDTLNELWLFCHIVTAGMILFAMDKVTSLAFQVKNHMKADTIAAEIETKLNRDDIVVSNWKEENSALMKTLQAQSISTKVVQFFILLSVAIGIGSVLSISVIHKQKQIGILKAMGISDHESGQIFTLQGLILGTIGTFFGFLFGLLMIFLFNLFTGVDVVTITIRLGFTLISLSSSMAAAVLAAYLPSRMSQQMQVIEIIQRS